MFVGGLSGRSFDRRIVLEQKSGINFRGLYIILNNSSERSRMRRKEKKQVEEFIGTLHSAHDEIKKQIENHNKELARKLLENCQDGAIQIGNLIETVEGEECPVIPMLEGYCEQVYQIYEELGYEEAVRADKSFKVLHRQLTRIENSVRYDIKGRLEIVFLPYKASMWDSLESVWMAADADENCDAYVIPIPYYDRNPDGILVNIIMRAMNSRIMCRSYTMTIIVWINADRM